MTALDLIARALVASPLWLPLAIGIAALCRRPSRRPKP